MKFSCSVKRLIDDQWQASVLGSEVGTVRHVGSTRSQAIEGLRDAIRCRLLQRPGGLAPGDFVELDVDEAPRANWRGTVF